MSLHSTILVSDHCCCFIFLVCIECLMIVSGNEQFISKLLMVHVCINLKLMEGFKSLFHAPKWFSRLGPLTLFLLKKCTMTFCFVIVWQFSYFAQAINLCI